MSNKTRGQGSERVMKKLKTSVELGQYYEAHQMYRTLYFRYLAQNRYDELITMLFDGAVLFLTHNQLNSGADLAVLLVDVLSESEKAVTDDHMDKLGHLFSLMSADSPERMSYLAAALRWSSKSTDGKNSTGHPRLHQSIALTLWKEKNYPQSRYHFIHSTDGHGCASMLVEYHITKGYPSEVDLFIAQTVFQFLCLKNRSTACTAFHSYTEKHPSVKGPPFLLPLLNFLQFLLLAVDRGEYSMDKKFFKGLGELRTILWGEREKLAFFKLLCEQYQPSLNRDPTYAEYVDRIGQLFFGLSPPPKQQGMLGNIIQSLLGSFDDDTFSNEETEPVAGSSKETVYRIQDEELD